MLASLDEALSLHVSKLFGVLVSDLEDERALARFERGIGNAMSAFAQAHSVITEKCLE